MSPLTVVLVPPTRPPRCALFTYTWYWLAPQLGTADTAFQPRLKEVVVWPEALSPVGTPGAALQPAPATVMFTVAEVVLAPRLSVATAVSA